MRGRKGGRCLASVERTHSEILRVDENNSVRTRKLMLESSSESSTSGGLGVQRGERARRKERKR